MSATRFRRSTEWRIDAPRQQVYEALRDLRGVGAWWPDFEDVRAMDDRSVRARVRGPVGFRFELRLRVEHAQPHERIVIRSSGDLEGTGVWSLSEDPRGTSVHYDWDVVLRKPLLATASPLLRGVFRRSHDAVMRRGERGLRDLLTRTAHRNSISPY